MTTYKLYKSDIEKTTNWVQYKLYNGIAEFDTCNIDHKNIKDFFRTLKISIGELKKDNISKIRQFVLIDDYNNNCKGKTTWTIVEQDNKQGTCVIQCNINNFLINFGKALGFDEM